MSDENNKRYIGEVFIDGKSDKLLQEFLTNLFNSYNGPGKGFNADMVDDWHLQDIIDYVDDGLKTKMDSIIIGNTVFTIYDSSKFLQLTDIIYNEFQDTEKAPWALKLQLDEQGEKYHRLDSSISEDQYLASDILLDIYYVLDIDKYDKESFTEFYNTKFNPLFLDHHQLKEDFYEFKQPFEDVLRDVEIIDIDGNTKTIKMIDAQLINGFRIIPITQAAYNSLPDSQKEYWRNIYIIVDEVPNDYVDPISFELFKDVKLVYNPDTQYIDYYDGISENPRPLISLADLVENINLTQQFSEFLSETTNYTINPTALKESIKEVVLKQADLPDLPFLTKDEAVVLTSDITSNNGTITSTRNTNNFTTFDISHAFDTKFNTIDNQFVDVRSTISNTDNDIRAYVSSNFVTQDSFNDIQGNITQSLIYMNAKLTERIKALEDKYYKNSVKIKVGRSYDNAGEDFKHLVIRSGYDSIYAKLYWDKPNLPANYFANRDVWYVINGVIYKRTTDNNGKAGELNINLLPGIYILDVFLGNTDDFNFNLTHTSKIIEVIKV